MPNFCTYCGTKLEKNASFCTNCGSKIEINEKPKNFLDDIKKTIQIARDDETKKANKEVKRICGGITLNDSFQNELIRNGLVKNDGIRIRGKIKSEINLGKIKSGDVRNRVDELLLEYKSQLEEQIEEFKFIDELFESDEIKSKTSKGKISQQKIISIKSYLKNKVRFSKVKLSEDEIKKEFKTELFKADRINYLENIIKDSCPNIKLTNFEKEYIDSTVVNGTIDEMKNELNRIAKRIINRYEKIEEYDFAGILIEDSGFTSGGPLSPNRVEKAIDTFSFAFLKIFDNNIFIVKTDTDHWIMKYDVMKDMAVMTLYFRDINKINYSKGKILLNLNGKEFTLKDYVSSFNNNYESFIEEFYKLLNNAWTKFKNNENNSLANKNRVSSADELMKYAELYEKGLLSEDEFNAIKMKLLQL